MRSRLAPSAEFSRLAQHETPLLSLRELDEREAFPEVLVGRSAVPENENVAVPRVSATSKTWVPASV